MSRSKNRRVDDQEPWRYECLGCGSVMVHVINHRGHRDPSKTYPGGIGNDGGMQAEKDRRARFYCHTCNERWERVRDKKSGHTVREAVL